MNVQYKIGRSELSWWAWKEL